MNLENNNISVQTVQKLLDVLQEAQFNMYALASALNKTADSITLVVREAGIKVVTTP